MALISDGETGGSVRTKLNSAVTHVAVTNVDSSQIKTLLTSPTIVIPSPGPGKAAVMTWMMAHYVFGTTPYTAEGTPTVVFGYDPSDLNNDALGDFGDFLTEAEDCVSFASNAQENNSFLHVSDIEDSPLYILCASDPAAGDGTITVTAYYFIIDV